MIHNYSYFPTQKSDFPSSDDRKKKKKMSKAEQQARQRTLDKIEARRLSKEYQKSRMEKRRVQEKKKTGPKVGCTKSNSKVPVNIILLFLLLLTISLIIFIYFIIYFS